MGITAMGTKMGAKVPSVLRRWELGMDILSFETKMKNMVGINSTAIIAMRPFSVPNFIIIGRIIEVNTIERHQKTPKIVNISKERFLLMIQRNKFKKVQIKEVISKNKYLLMTKS